MGEINQIGFVQKLLSYLRPEIIEQTQSPYNPQLDVILDKAELQLCTSSAIYSYGNKYYNFRKSIALLDWSKLGKEALVLGLGLGSIPQMIEQVFKQQLKYTAVEIDEVVIELAHRYCLKSLSSSIEYIATDALHFVELNANVYDIIFMDIFQGMDVPLKFETVAFLERLASLESVNGITIYNRLALEDKNKEENAVFEEKFKSVFPNYYTQDILFNRMYFSNQNMLKL